MQHTFFIKIADLTVKISSKYSLTYELCRDFLVDSVENPDIVSFATDKEIQTELENCEEPTTPEYSEFACIYRVIAEKLPDFNCFVFHGAAISYENNGYIFTAQSGTGKSTHIKLWRQYLGKAADIINGDKPIIKITNDGILICSTPWAGKENWKKNRIFKLNGIVFLERSKVCFAEKLAPKDSLSKIMNQVYLPKNSTGLVKTIENIDKLLSQVPLLRFGCDISENAVKTAFEALTNQNYQEKKL